MSLIQRTRQSKNNPRLTGPSLIHEEIPFFLSTIVACNLPFFSSTSTSNDFDSTPKPPFLKLFQDPARTSPSAFSVALRKPHTPLSLSLSLSLSNPLSLSLPLLHLYPILWWQFNACSMRLGFVGCVGEFCSTKRLSLILKYQSCGSLSW